MVRSVGAVSTGGTPLTPGAPAGKVNGDLLLLFVEDRDGNALSGLTGWTAHPDSPVKITGGSPAAVQMLYRIADGTAADTPSITGHSNHGVARMIAIVVDSLLNPRDEQTAQQGDI